METLTALVAASASFFVLYLPLSYAVIIYVALLAWYPIYLTIPIFGLNFNACRIVIGVIFSRILLQKQSGKGFKPILLDKLVIMYFLCQLFAGMQTIPIGEFLVNRSGAIMDQLVVYFVVRLTIRYKEEYVRLLRGILIIAGPLAIFGLYECVTGHNLFSFLQQYAAFGAAHEYVPVARSGFYRASATFGETIMFGLFFAMLGPICIGLLKNAGGNKKSCIIGLVLIAGGVFSSMSSGALLSALTSVVFIAFYFYRRYWKVVLAVILLGCCAVEIISNRHFYDVVGDLTFDPSNAWYRSRLIDVALFEGGMSGHWLVGYGMNDAGWGAKIMDSSKTDLVNHYIAVLYEHGLLGLVPFLAILIAAIANIIKAYKMAVRQSEKWFVWCLASVMAGVLPAMMTVSLFGPVITLFYIILGLCGAMPLVISNAVLAARAKN